LGLEIWVFIFKVNPNYPKSLLAIKITASSTVSTGAMQNVPEQM
jgi:hypothetical protein